MTAANRARVKTLFLDALKIGPEERDDFLRKECGDDTELLREVESLLANHFSNTIIATSLEHPNKKDTKVGGHIGPDKNLDSLKSRLAGSFMASLLSDKWKRYTLLFALTVALAVLGVWTRLRLKQSLQTIRAEQLQTILDADVLALKSWIEERRAEAEQWAADSRIREQVRILAEIGNDGSEERATALWDSPAHTELKSLVQPYLDQRGSAFVTVSNETGRSLFDPEHKQWLREKVTAKGMQYISRVFDGETVFVRPIMSEKLKDNRSAAAEVPYIWTAAPVYAKDVRGRTPEEKRQIPILASLNFAKRSDGQFSDILQVARMGKSGETYAFNDKGTMLTESRFTDQLQEIGLLKDQEAEYSMLKIQLRDPGGNMTKGYRPSNPDAQPFTRAVLVATAQRDSTSVAHQGQLLEPYRDYRGVSVIGAWQWLPEYDFGVVTEVDAEEAYAPLVYLDITFGILFTMLIIAVAYSVVSSISVLQLREEVGDARQLGQYTLLDKIGEGGMGQVYLAQHAMLKRPTAIKMLRESAVTEETKLRFEREVQLASQLSHPNTIEIYDYGHTPDGVFYYAMEYLDGVSLSELVKQTGPLPPARVAHIIQQVCASLREAHDLGFVHRDIKPLNIMACRRGGMCDVVKVLDFGLVKDVEDQSSVELTRPMQISGTPLYMSPERFRDPKSTDARSDIYAVGAVAYFLLAGRHAFDGANNTEVFVQVLNDTPAPPSAHVDHAIPGELDDLVMSCLAKEKEKRPQSASEVMARLDDIDGIPPWTEEESAAWWLQFESKRQSKSQSQTAV